MLYNANNLNLIPFYKIVRYAKHHYYPSSDFHNSIKLVFGTPRYSLYVRVMTSAYVKGQPGF